MIKKVWAKFDGMDLECVCDEHHRKCKSDSGCQEYVAKFIEVNRTEEDFKDAAEHVERETKNLRRDIKKFKSELSKSVRAFKKFKI